MKKPRYTEQQIAQALRQVEHGTPATEVCRKLGVSEKGYPLLRYAETPTTLVQVGGSRTRPITLWPLETIQLPW